MLLRRVYAKYQIIMESDKHNFAKLLETRECTLLSDILGDSPQTVIPTHILRRGFCKAYILGNLPKYQAVLIQPESLQDELIGFSSEPETLFEVLKNLQGWRCVNVNSKHSNTLGRIIEERMGIHVKYCNDITLTQSKIVNGFHNECVRQLTISESKLLEEASPEIREWTRSFFGTPEALLSEGIVACAMRGNRIISVAHTGSRTRHYSDIGVYTLKEFRGQGLATSAASLVAKMVHADRQVPVWSAGGHNTASLRVAQKMGFSEVSRSTNVIVAQDDLVARE
jgi:RimJ/RimL family protein N-acetyltransferase